MTGATPPPTQPKQPIDKAYSIASIKAYIPTPLDLDKLNYNAWSALFTRFCRTYKVHHHLDAPTTTETSNSTIDPLHESNDSLVVMWMYSTISPKLVEMVVDDDTSSHGVWKRLTDLFQNNKDARIKSKADRFANLDSSVKDTSLVTYAVNGIRSKYPDAARVIRIQEKAPTFDELRSMMLLEESDMSHKSVPNVVPKPTVPNTNSNTGQPCMAQNPQLKTLNMFTRPISAGPTRQSHAASPTRPTWPNTLYCRILVSVLPTRKYDVSKLCYVIIVPSSGYYAPTGVSNYDTSTNKLEHGYYGIFASTREHKHKCNADGSLSRYKARLVANGRSQQQGINCDETFSSVVKPTTIRTVLSFAVTRDWHIHQLDVKNAFLHGQLSETVIRSRAWFQRFASFITCVGFKHIKTDMSLFVFHQGSDIAYLLLCVDDIFFTASSIVLLQCIITLLHAEILERAHMQHCNPWKTPVDIESKLGSDGDPISSPTLYRSLAGALQYLTFTRPNISYAVQQICLYMHDPHDPYFNALKHILRYVHGTLDHGLQLHVSSASQLTAFTDAD
ncbi:ribonuclease H-like domain-containing protein [Tanacetum coccineum]